MTGGRPRWTSTKKVGHRWCADSDKTHCPSYELFRNSHQNEMPHPALIRLQQTQIEVLRTVDDSVVVAAKR